MKHSNWQTMWRAATMTLAVAGGVMTLPRGNALAKPRPAPRERSESTSVEGRVKSLTTAPKGETDGAVLEDGTVLHWPPHLEDRFADVAKEGSRVRVVGWSEVGPEGERRLEVKSLTNTDTRATAENDGPGPRDRKGKAPPPPRRRGPARTLEGTIERFTTAPKGETDGAVLDDGTVLHWPPHLADSFAGIIGKGDRVKATGFEETTPKGDEHFELESLTNLDTNKSFENDEAALPRRDDPRPKPRAERDDRESRSERIRRLKDEVRRLQREIERLEDE